MTSGFYYINYNTVKYISVLSNWFVRFLTFGLCKMVKKYKNITTQTILKINIDNDFAYAKIGLGSD